MNRIDWQAYLDGSLTPAECREAETILQKDDSAKKELDGLRSFVGLIKDSALDEGVPISRLEALIPAARPAERPKLRLLSWGVLAPSFAAAATILLAYLWIAKAGAKIEFLTNSPLAAATWATDQANYQMPIIELGEDAPMTRVHMSAEKCCFDYKYKGQMYHVNVYAKGEGKGTDGEPVRLVNGITAYHTKGIAWTQDKWDFYVSGKGTEWKEDIANRVVERIAHRA